MQPSIKDKRKAYYWANKNMWKAYIDRSNRLKIKQNSMYGMVPGQWDALHAAQKGVCAICGNPPKQKALAVDHCHATGKVRALLCHRCNNALGLFRDDPIIMAKAIAYLHAHHPSTDPV